MEYVIIGACIVVAIAGGIVLYVKNKRTKNELGNTAVVVSKTSSSKLQASEVANDPVIQIGILPADAISDETKLVEITDSKVLAHINNLVPGLAQAGNAANNATQAVKANGEVLYRAIIPAGAKLTDSKAMEGAVRGFYHGADGIRGHANLVAVEAQKGTAVAAMGVASMIVGQYYMTQINAELGVISDGICSKYSGDVVTNTEAAKRYSRFAVGQDAIPLAPHLLLPLYMKEESERELAMFMDMVLLGRCDELWVFGGEASAGMCAEIAKAKRHGKKIRYFDSLCNETNRALEIGPERLQEER